MEEVGGAGVEDVVGGVSDVVGGVVSEVVGGVDVGGGVLLVGGVEGVVGSEVVGGVVSLVVGGTEAGVLSEGELASPPGVLTGAEGVVAAPGSPVLLLVDMLMLLNLNLR